MKTVSENADIGIVVARFQCPFLHEGHTEVLDHVCKNHSRVIIYLGVSPLRSSYNNPLDVITRQGMINEKYPKIEVDYIEDVGDDRIWSRNLDKKIGVFVSPAHKVILYGSRDSFVDRYFGKYKTVELVPSIQICAGEIRRRIGIKSLNTEQFRIGAIHSTQNRFPAFQPCVDVAIINQETNQILLGSKKNDLGNLRFIGGFMDPQKDKSAEDAAKREALEETSINVEIISYIGSTLVDEWRYANELDKIMTFFFATKYVGGTPTARDDMDFIFWKDIASLTKDMFTKEHKVLFDMFNNWLHR